VRLFITFCFIVCGGILSAQADADVKFKNTLLAKLGANDSLVYYQCRATTAAVEVKTSNQQIESKEQHISITEKFVIIHKADAYVIRYFTSGMTVLPNRKFSGLKLREKSYWEFKYKTERILSAEEIKFLSGLQTSGKETTEYDFTISKHTTNQIIIKQKKDFEQLLLKDKLSISEALKL
jgi:hypothetical protein